MSRREWTPRDSHPGPRPKLGQNLSNGCTPLDLDPPHLHATLSPHTIRRHHAILSALYQWLTDLDRLVVHQDPVDGARPPKAPGRSPGDWAGGALASAEPPSQREKDEIRRLSGETRISSAPFALAIVKGVQRVYCPEKPFLRRSDLAEPSNLAWPGSSGAEIRGSPGREFGSAENTAPLSHRSALALEGGSFIMVKARVNGKLVVAGPDAPEEALCPDCGGKVRVRHRARMDGETTYFYRHIQGEGKNCPRRYRPTFIWQASATKNT